MPLTVSPRADFVIDDREDARRPAGPSRSYHALMVAGFHPPVVAGAAARGMLAVEKIGGDAAFRHLGALPAVALDLRYAGCRNFAGRSLYGDLDCAWLRDEAAAGLETAAAWLARHCPQWRIVVLDALRPQRVQEAIWRGVVGTPVEPYFADPGPGSIHSYGMAVDVTLVDRDGVEADMGTGFDEMTPASHPELHRAHLASGLLSTAQVARRTLLRDAMAAGGFNGIATEWWHFDHGDAARVRRELPRVY